MPRRSERDLRRANKNKEQEPDKTRGLKKKNEKCDETSHTKRTLHALAIRVDGAKKKRRTRSPIPRSAAHTNASTSNVNVADACRFRTSHARTHARKKQKCTDDTYTHGRTHIHTRSCALRMSSSARRRSASAARSFAFARADTHSTRARSTRARVRNTQHTAGARSTHHMSTHAERGEWGLVWCNTLGLVGVDRRM